MALDCGFSGEKRTMNGYSKRR